MHMLATFNNAVPMAFAGSTTLSGHDIQVLIVAAIGIAIVVLLIAFIVARPLAAGFSPGALCRKCSATLP